MDNYPIRLKPSGTNGYNVVNFFVTILNFSVTYKVSNGYMIILSPGTHKRPTSSMTTTLATPGSIMTICTIVL